MGKKRRLKRMRQKTWDSVPRDSKDKAHDLNLDGTDREEPSNTPFVKVEPAGDIYCVSKDDTEDLLLAFQPKWGGFDWDVTEYSGNQRKCTRKGICKVECLSFEFGRGKATLKCTNSGWRVTKNCKPLKSGRGY